MTNGNVWKWITGILATALLGMGSLYAKDIWDHTQDPAGHTQIEVLRAQYSEIIRRLDRIENEIKR